MAGARVALVSTAPVSSAADFRPRVVFTDEEGSFAFRGVEAGDYEVRAEAQGLAVGHERQTFAVSDGSVDGIEIRLSAGASLVGRILGVAFEDLARVRVRARRDGFGSAPGTVSYQAEYRIDQLAVGSWKVTANVLGTDRWVRRVVRIEPGVEETGMDLDFDSGLVLSGQVLAEGVGVPGVRVLVMAPARTGAAVTDASGRFQVTDLDPGVYRLEVLSPRGVLFQQPALPLDSDLEIRLDVETEAPEVSER